MTHIFPRSSLRKLPPDLSVVIPVYNRGILIRHTLESVRQATRKWSVEIVIVDDGSNPPLTESLSAADLEGIRLYRQDNQGLLFARLAGLGAATGEFVLFLDSDDLVHPDKFDRQLTAMRDSRADASYSDEGAVPLDDSWKGAAITNLALKPTTTDSVVLFVEIQPAPHNVIFRTAYLAPLIREAWMPPSKLFNSVAEIWFYYLCATARPAKVVKCDGPLTIQGIHPTVRLSSHWERLALGSLAVMESFVRFDPHRPEMQPARIALGERAFLAWRALPPDTPDSFQSRLIAVLEKLPEPPLERCGGRGFQLLSRLLGRRAAGSILRRRQRPPYESIRTLPPGEFSRLAAQMSRP